MKKRLIMIGMTFCLLLSACEAASENYGDGGKSGQQVESENTVGGSASAESSSANGKETEKPAETERPVATEKPAETEKPVAMTEPNEPSVNYLLLSDQEQYEINVFLSNFAEQGYRNVSIDMSRPDINWLGNFAYIYTKYNSRSKVSLVTVQQESYYSISLERFNEVVTRFFGLSFTDAEVEGAYSDTAYSFYQNNAFYFMAADGDTGLVFAVADTMFEDEGEYYVTFDVYELDQDIYDNVGGSNVTKEHYALRPEKVIGRSDVFKVGHGAAEVKPYQMGNRSTYQLISLTMDAD